MLLEQNLREVNDIYSKNSNIQYSGSTITKSSGGNF